MDDFERNYMENLPGEEYSRDLEDDEEELEYLRSVELLAKAKKVTQMLTDYVNNFSNDPQYFIKELCTEHRTLQQSVTKLMFKWIEYAASEDYRFDKRNEAVHEICKQIIAKFKLENGYNVNPSDYLPCI